jgi:hypothetical protein
MSNENLARSFTAITPSATADPVLAFVTPALHACVPDEGAICYADVTSNGIDAFDASRGHSGAMRWTVNIIGMPDEKFGARMVKLEDYLSDAPVMAVKSVRPDGMLAKYNLHFPEKAVQVHDVFLSVNHISGEWSLMLEELKKQELEILVERPTKALGVIGARWTVEITKPLGERIGARFFSVRKCRDRTVLAVSDCGSGALLAHNMANPATGIARNDVIISVNEEIDPIKMVDEMFGGIVTIVVERPHPKEVQPSMHNFHF